MKPKTFSLLLLLLMLSPLSFTWGAVNRSFHVIIDPGHGGIDSGAVKGALREADITLSVGRYLADLIQNQSGLQATLTRQSDVTLSLEERTDLAVRSHGDLFISIHVNASTIAAAHGFEIYFENQLPPDEEEFFVATRENEAHESMGITKESLNPKESNNDIAIILDDLKHQSHIKRSFFYSKKTVELLSQKYLGEKAKKYPPKKVALRQAPFFVISHVKLPSVLVELAYLTNPKEFELLSQPSFQKEMAHLLYDAVLNYKEMVDKESSTP